jgi:hypothetical protein
VNLVSTQKKKKLTYDLQNDKDNMGFEGATEKEQEEAVEQEDDEEQEDNVV